VDAASPIPFVIRSFRSCDADACRRLFKEGRLGEAGPDADDPGADVESIERFYGTNGSHFWVAEIGPSDPRQLEDELCVGDVIAMIGVLRHDDGTAEIRRLRVDGRVRRRGIGSAMVERAVRFCHENNYLRIIMDTYMERQPAVQLFQKFHFQHGRTRAGKTKDRLYFYLDLYGGGPQQQADSGVGAQPVEG
jgi:ribosomal protein S18 acetylase RimI-like enzyme